MPLNHKNTKYHKENFNPITFKLKNIGITNYDICIIILVQFSVLEFLWQKNKFQNYKNQ